MPSVKMNLRYYFVAVLFTCFIKTGSSEVKTYYLDEICSSTVHISTTAQVKVKATRSLAYDNNMDCTAYIVGEYRFMIEFKDLDMESGDRLRLTGDTSDSRLIGTVFSGYSTPSTIYTTSDAYLKFVFTSDFAVPGKGFYIILTQFTEAPCSSWEYKCNTHKCVNSTVECGYLNPCQSRDCPVTKAAATVITILIIAAIICSILCAMIGVYLRVRRGAGNIFRTRRTQPIGLVAAIVTTQQQPPVRSVQSTQPVQPPPYTPQPAGSAPYPPQPQPYSPGQSVQNPIYGQPMHHPSYGQPTQNPAYGPPAQNLSYGQTTQNPPYSQTVENPTYGQPVQRSTQKPGLYVLDANGKEIDPATL